MRINALKDEDFVNYKKPAMFLGTIKCDWKCCTEHNMDKSICQNSSLSKAEIMDIPTDVIFRRYISNPITKAVVIGGLEPFLQFDEIFELIKYFRERSCNDRFIVYTGYYEAEILDQVFRLSRLKNIIIKFGRYIPDQEKHFDEVLGISLASDNQYAKVIDESKGEIVTIC